MTMFSNVYDFKIIFFWYKCEANTKNELLKLCLKQDSNPPLEKLTKGKPVPLDHLSHSTIHVFSNYHCTSVKTVAVSESKAIGTPAP